MAHVVNILRSHPEIVFFFVLGIGYLLGKLTIGGFKLGAVTGTLLAGVLVGQLGVTVAGDVKQCFFLLFLFAIGFRTGPQFFRGLKGEGLGQAALAALVATTGLVVAFGISRVLHYDPGTAGGLVAGSLTESATLGTASDAIGHLPLTGPQKEALTNNLPVAFAVTYLIGVILTAWFLAQVAPKILGVNLAEECRRLEEQLGAHGSALSARREFEFRSYLLLEGSPLVGRGIADLEKSGKDERFFIERLRHDGQVLEAQPSTSLCPGDVIAVSGRRHALAEDLDPARRGLREVDDKELLDLSIDVVDVVLTNPDIDGRTLGSLGAAPSARGVFLRQITRAGSPVLHSPGVELHRGDVLTLVGSEPHIAEAAKIIGYVDRRSDAADMVGVALGIVAGALIGLPAFRSGALEIGLSVSVGVLIGGLVCGWLRSLHPRVFGRIPGPTLWIFESIGLTGFIAIVGLNAGPDFVKGLQTSGLTLILAGALTITLPLLVGVLAGRFLFKMHPGVMLGVIAGACTATPALAAVQETAQSAVPTLGYGVAYAVGNTLLALWGAVIVALLA
jgi:putative transport protein